MKELYVSPEVKLLGFAPVEQLASDYYAEMDDVIGGNSSGGVSNVTPDIGDVDVDISL